MKKKILITGGSSWVALDDIRIITNVFTGSTSVFLAAALARRGYSVTLLINPLSGNLCGSLSGMNASRIISASGSELRGGSAPERARDRTSLSGVTVIPYVWFDECIAKITSLLKRQRFDCIIHSAALSDFYPVRRFHGKISSKKDMSIRLKPAPKVITLIRSLSKAVLVQFKLESNISTYQLIRRAYQSLKQNTSDFVIANDYTALRKGVYRRYLIDARKNVRMIPSQQALPKAIEKYVLTRLAEPPKGDATRKGDPCR